MDENKYIPDPFLRESWQRLGGQEKGEDDKETKGARLWREIELAVRKDAVLGKIAEQVKKDIVHYQATIRAFKETRRERTTAQDIGEIELKYENEGRAHKRLVDDVNLLSRQFRERGLSNKWREDIGLTYEEVGRWAENLQII